MKYVRPAASVTEVAMEPAVTATPFPEALPDIALSPSTRPRTDGETRNGNAPLEATELPVITVESAVLIPSMFTPFAMHDAIALPVSVRDLGVAESLTL